MTRKQKRRYQVTGSTSYRGHAPGDEFEAVLTDDEERRAIDRGSIAVATSKTSTRREDDAEGNRP